MEDSIIKQVNKDLIDSADMVRNKEILKLLLGADGDSLQMQQVALTQNEVDKLNSQLNSFQKEQKEFNKKILTSLSILAGSIGVVAVRVGIDILQPFLKGLGI